MQYVYKKFFILLLYLLLPIEASAAAYLQVDIQPKTISLDLFHQPTEVDIMIKAVNLPDNLSLLARLIGPKQELQLAKKTKHWGLWVDSTPVIVKEAPFYYLVAANNLTSINKPLLKDLKFGISPEPFISSSADPQYLHDFIGFKIAKQEYPASILDIAKLTDKSYNLHFILPKSAVPGSYRLEIYAIEDTRILAHWRGSIQIAKSGFIKNLQNFTHNHGVITGVSLLILVVLISLLSRFLLRNVSLAIKFKK